MTTLNAKANTAYNELIAATERENPGDVWAGFDGDQDAFETGYEAGHKAAQPVVDREALHEVLAAWIEDCYGIWDTSGDGGESTDSDRQAESAVDAVMELARPMPTREQIESEVRRVIFAYFGTYERPVDLIADAVLTMLAGSAK